MDKIFVIEDDAGLRGELLKLLASYGYACESSNDFQNIVPAALAAQADLVLLDVSLPYYDGFQVCRELRKSSAVPVIVVTSRSSEMDELLSMNLGADDFVAKPFNPQILLARIAAVLKRARPAAHEDEPLRYRNKASFPFGTEEDRACFGFFAPRSHRLAKAKDLSALRRAYVFSSSEDMLSAGTSR